MFRVVTPLIIRSACHCICSTWHFLAGNCSSQSDTLQTGSSTVSLMPDTADTVIWAPDDEWSYHSKHVQQFTNINKLYFCILLDNYWYNLFSLSAASCGSPHSSYYRLTSGLLPIMHTCTCAVFVCVMCYL
jgi:hypothetical protein